MFYNHSFLHFLLSIFKKCVAIRIGFRVHDFNTVFFTGMCNSKCNLYLFGSTQDVWQFLAVGLICQQVPNRPELPPGFRLTNLMGIPLKPGKKREMVCAVGSSDEDLK